MLLSRVLLFMSMLQQFIHAEDALTVVCSNNGVITECRNKISLNEYLNSDIYYKSIKTKRKNRNPLSYLENPYIYTDDPLEHLHVEKKEE